MKDSKKIVVIGAGFAGLAAAAKLAQAGHDVHLIEKNDQTGGRARIWGKDGFTFDMGPSWYWMPEVFDNFFKEFGKKTADFYELKRLSPSYRVYFGANDFIDVPADFQALLDLFESIERKEHEEVRLTILEILKNFLEEDEGNIYYIARPGKWLRSFIGTLNPEDLPYKSIDQKAKMINKNFFGLLQEELNKQWLNKQWLNKQGNNIWLNQQGNNIYIDYAEDSPYKIKNLYFFLLLSPDIAVKIPVFDYKGFAFLDEEECLKKIISQIKSQILEKNLSFSQQDEDSIKEIIYRDGFINQLLVTTKNIIDILPAKKQPFFWDSQKGIYIQIKNTFIQKQWDMKNKRWFY